MLKEPGAHQHALEMVTLESLVPEDHLLRQIDACIDFEFIRDKVSRSDKDSGYMVREGKPKGFFYLDHRTVDGKHAIITDSHVTAANVHDSRPYLARLDRQRQRFGLEVEAVGLDAGYMSAAICKGLEDRHVYGVIGYRRPNHKSGYFYKREYRYDSEADVYICPAEQRITYNTTNRRGYREYKSDPQVCKRCPLLMQCTRSTKHIKVITRHVWQDSKERIDRHRLMDAGKKIYARRKETVERSFADAKQLHGHRYARMRGLDKVREQCLLAAACQNMKKIAQVKAHKALLSLIRWLSRPIRRIRWSQIDSTILPQLY